MRGACPARRAQGHDLADAALRRARPLACRAGRPVRLCRRLLFLGAAARSTAHRPTRIRISGGLTLCALWASAWPKRGSNGRENQSDAARLLLAAARERFAVAATDLLLPDHGPPDRMAAPHRRGSAQPPDPRHRGRAARPPRRPVSRAMTRSTPLCPPRMCRSPLPILERAGALRDADLSAVLVRRVEEHRFWKAHAPAAGATTCCSSWSATPTRRSPPRRWSWSSPAAAASTASRSPHMGQVELPAELQHKLVWIVAAALRHYIVQQHRLAARRRRDRGGGGRC